ncbi:MAG TPA: N-acetylmuramoyl-L-alanine amidase [Opitutaceae bacterium]|nr:N-acetylmuramoyl-L-alanine amidase [Opitutaceae bacterium]
MARPRTCRRAVAALGAVGLLLAVAAAQSAAPKGPAPSAPKADKAVEPPESAARAPGWKTTKLYGVDYVSLADVAARLGLKTSWVRAREELRLEGEGTDLTFELDKRDLRWNGLRVFFGEPIITHRRMLWMAEIDVRTTLFPLLQPATVPPAGPLRVIVLDPGHGGTDSGTQNEKLKLHEKTFTLDVAQRLRPLLEARGYKVVLTREKDTRFHSSPAVDLPMRADFANKAKADLFVSIHFNALGNGDVHGIETYAFTPGGLRSSGEDERDPDGEKPQPANRHDHWSLVAAGAMHEKLRGQVEGFDRGLKRARWAVLRPLACPGVLVECGFLTNEAEARRISAPAHRQKIAEGIAAGIDAYAARVKEATPPPPKRAPAAKS